MLTGALSYLPWFLELVSCTCRNAFPFSLQLQPAGTCPLTSCRVPHLGEPGHRQRVRGVQPRALPEPHTHASTHPACGPGHRRTRRTYGPWARPPCPAATRSRGVSVPRPPSLAALHPAPASSPGGSRLRGGRVRLGRGQGPTLPRSGPTQRACVGQDGGKILLLQLGQALHVVLRLCGQNR